MKISATHHSSGEVVELPVNTYEEVIEAWQVAKDYAELAEMLKYHLKKLVPKYVGDNGVSEPANGFMFRMSNVQRTNYNPAVLRENIKDEDTLSLLLVPDKPRIDAYLKENLESLGEVSSILRQTMIPMGKPYTTIRLERLERADAS